MIAKDKKHKNNNKLATSKKILLCLLFFLSISSIIYYINKVENLDSIIEEKIIYMTKGKNEYLIELNNIKESISKLYIEDNDENIDKLVEEIEIGIKEKSKKEIQELIDNLKLQVNEISAKNQIELEEEYNKINDEVINNYTEEEETILDEYRNSYEKAYNDKDFILAKEKLYELECYIQETNKLANKRRITQIYELNSNSDPSTREPFYVNGIIVVNKEHGVSSDFAPGESYEARQAFEEMKYAASLEGIYLNAFSTYRSYWRQDRLYNNYVYEYGEEKADTFSARAGFSEHQTGLAFDIGGLDGNLWAQDDFRYTEEAKWLSENAYKYGFILRFPEGKEWITGYQYESWHFRYIGVEDSINFKDNNLTLEEYLGLVEN